MAAELPWPLNTTLREVVRIELSDQPSSVICSCVADGNWRKKLSPSPVLLTVIVLPLSWMGDWARTSMLIVALVVRWPPEPELPKSSALMVRLVKPVKAVDGQERKPA